MVTILDNGKAIRIRMTAKHDLPQKVCVVRGDEEIWFDRNSVADAVAKLLGKRTGERDKALDQLNTIQMMVDAEAYVRKVLGNFGQASDPEVIRMATSNVLKAILRKE